MRFNSGFKGLKTFQTKVVQKTKINILRSMTFLRENRTVYNVVVKYGTARQGHRQQYGARAWHAGYLRLQTHTQNT